MKFDGIKEVNEMPSDTSQVYVSNYGLIRGMINSPYVVGEFVDSEAEMEHSLYNGSVYSQGLDDVSFNMQEVLNKQNNVEKVVKEEPKEIVKEEPKEKEEEVKDK